MTEDLRSGLSSSVLHPSPRLPWQDVAMAAVGQIIRTNQLLEIIRLEVVQMRQPRVVMSPLMDWVSNNIIPTTGSVITMPQMCAAINSDKLYGNHGLHIRVVARGVGQSRRGRAAGGHADHGGGGGLPRGRQAVEDQQDQVVQVEEDDLARALPAGQILSGGKS